MVGYECDKHIQIENTRVYKEKDNSYVVTFNTNLNKTRQEIRGQTREETVSKIALRFKRILHVR